MRSAKGLVTVSPPSLDRSGFLALERRLAGVCLPQGRDWLLSRLIAGLQIRMLCQPARGFVSFVPEGCGSCPLLGGEGAVIVESLRLDPELCPGSAVRGLLQATEDWARFYGYSTILGLRGHRPWLLDPDLDLGPGWGLLDHGPEGEELWGKVLQGPVRLPRLGGDWQRRRAGLGKELLIQVAPLSRALRLLAKAIAIRARRAGLQVRLEELGDPFSIRERAVAPMAPLALLWRGQLIASDGGLDAIWSRIEAVGLD